MIESFSTVKIINRIKSTKKAIENNKAAIANPGIDSNTDSEKLCQYFITIPGSENIRDKNDPKLDSAIMLLIPIKANMNKTKNTAIKTMKNFRCLLIRINSLSSPKRLKIRKKRPRGSVTEVVILKDRFSCSSRIYINTNEGYILVHPSIEYVLIKLC